MVIVPGTKSKDKSVEQRQMGGGQAHTESSSKDSHLFQIKHQHPVERQIRQLNLAEGCFYELSRN